MSPMDEISGVIIADDDPLVRSVLRSRLESLGQTVFLAADGQEAVDFAKRMRASLILLDLNMPRVNGLMACMAIRALPNNARTPIVALTAVVRPDARVAAIRAGVDIFLTKPFGIATLLGVLTRFLPLDDITRLAIVGEAARAAQIAKLEPTSATTGLAASGASALDRSRQVLTVLRG